MKNKPPAYFLKVNHKGIPLHGGICYYDTDRIMENKGIIPIVFPEVKGSRFVSKMVQLSYILRMFMKVRRNAIFFVQLPLYHRMGRWLLLLLARYKHIRPAACMMDIDGLRDGNKALLQKEIADLLHFDLFIAQNEYMKRWIARQRPGAVITCIRFFDFLITPSTPPRQRSTTIAFAGNLVKSPFLEKLSSLRNCPSIIFHLYGLGATDAMMQQRQVNYNGVVGPYELPGKLTASFGLVWDGESLDGCTGSTGEYLHYNSPHKLSLYIISGMPVIAPRNTPSGELVEKYRIGFCIDTLHELESRINEVSDEEYQQMATNTHELAAIISTGECLGSALSELMPEISSGNAPKQ